MTGVPGGRWALQAGGGASCALGPSGSDGCSSEGGSWSGVCVVQEGNERQVFVGFVSKTLVKYFWALWRLLLALWEQTTAECQLPKKHLLPGAGGSGQTPTALSRVQWGCCGEGMGLQPHRVPLTVTADERVRPGELQQRPGHPGSVPFPMLTPRVAG